MIYDNCMSCQPKSSNCNNCMRGLAILVGIVAGIIFSAAFTALYIFELLPLAYVGIAVALGVALIYLFVVLVSGFSGAKCKPSKLSDCICCNIGSLFFGIFGTITFGIFGVSSAVFSLSIASIIFVALTAFFFAYMLVTIFFLVKCLICS